MVSGHASQFLHAFAFCNALPLAQDFLDNLQSFDGGFVVVSESGPGVYYI